MSGSTWSTTLGPRKKPSAGQVELAAVERDVGAFLRGDVEIAGDLVAMLAR